MTVLELPRPAGVSATSFFVPWVSPYPVLPKASVAARIGQLARYLRGDRAFAQLIRFALVGGSSNIAYVLLFFAMHGVGPLIANVAGSVVSTVIANELHRQLTFHAAGRVGWFTAQWEGGGLALVGLGITTAALATLGVWAPGLGDTAQAAAILAITAAVGGMRFLALRGLVF
ncbi:GtrA family protein [Nocardia asiatica]|uniref:GtrA family protein n=1 Tax=Nocardia asiatica TaxID=209252 RepID=UPI00245610A8|nr:GtrA family protein [Nocardia asiatica]